MKSIVARIIEQNKILWQSLIAVAAVALFLICQVSVFTALLLGTGILISLTGYSAIATFYRVVWGAIHSVVTSPNHTGIFFRGLTAVFGVGALWVVFNLLVNPKYRSNLYATPEVLGVLVLFIALLPAVWSGCRRIARAANATAANKRRLLLIITFVGVFVLMLAMGYAVLRPLGSDPMTITRTAQMLMQGDPLDPSRVRYYERYPNVIFMTLIFWKIFTVADWLGISDLSPLRMILVVLNAVVMTAAVALTFVVAKRVAGGIAAVFSLGLSTAFLIISPWIGVPYSDTLGTIFPILLMYFYLRSRDTGNIRVKVVYFGLLGIVAAVGYAVKPTVIFTLLAIIGVLAVKAIVQKISWRSLKLPVIVAGVSVALFCVSHVGLGAIQNNSSTVPFDISNNQGAFPATHFLMMGAQGTGGYSSDDVRVSLSIESADDRFWNGLEVYGERVSAMGFEGYVSFLGSKALFTWGDGSFAQRAEGGARDKPFSHDDPVSETVQSYYDSLGDNRQVLLNFWQATWVLVLLLLAVPLVVKRRKLLTDPLVMMRVAITMLTIFLLLFETRARYLYLYLPLIIVLASASFVALFGQLDRFVRRTSLRRPSVRLR